MCFEPFEIKFLYRLVILRKSLTKHIFQKLEKSCLLRKCIVLCDILYSQNLRSIYHKDVHLCIFITKTSFVGDYITKAKSSLL